MKTQSPRVGDVPRRPFRRGTLLRLIRQRHLRGLGHKLKENSRYWAASAKKRGVKRSSNSNRIGNLSAPLKPEGKVGTRRKAGGFGKTALSTLEKAVVSKPKRRGQHQYNRKKLKNNQG